MHRLLYGFFYLLSLLPLRVLYLLTDALYFFFYHLLRYRKAVVMQNLALAFPNKSGKERTQIAREFYRNFTDFFAETIKLFSADAAWVNRHFSGDYSLLNNLHRQGRKCQVHLGHNFNWETGFFSAITQAEAPVLGVYMPLSNAGFEQVFQRLRTRLGGHLLRATNMRREIMPFRHQAYALLLIADQSPGDPAKAFWVPFFGRPTPFLSAPENGARIARLPVLFCWFEKLKRGHYKAHLELATDDASLLPKGALTKQYAVFLEEKMKQDPALWLWSHRRWKHQWQEAYGPVLS